MRAVSKLKQNKRELSSGMITGNKGDNIFNYRRLPSAYKVRFVCLRNLFLFMTLIFLQACGGKVGTESETKSYIAPNGAVFEKAYLRQYIIQDEGAPIGAIGATFIPVYLLDYTVAPYTLIPQSIGIKPGVILGHAGSFYPERKGTLDLDATFFEVFVADLNDRQFPAELKSFSRNTPIVISDHCLFYSGVLDGEERLILFSEMSIDDESAFVCTTRAHLYYFGLRGINNDQVSRYLLEPSSRNLDFALNFDSVRTDLKSIKKETDIRQ